MALLPRPCCQVQLMLALSGLAALQLRLPNVMPPADAAVCASQQCCLSDVCCPICLPALPFPSACRHGDLKAGNVLLQASTGISRAAVSMDQQQKLLRVWTEAGCLPLVAKVADFGLSLPLGHQDTHATLHARG